MFQTESQFRCHKDGNQIPLARGKLYNTRYIESVMLEGEIPHYLLLCMKVYLGMWLGRVQGYEKMNALLKTILSVNLMCMDIDSKALDQAGIQTQIIRILLLPLGY